MFAASLSCLRRASAQASRLPTLRRRLHHLRQTNRAAEEQLQERRRLHHLLRSTKSSTRASSAASESEREKANANALRLLPRNDALEAAMALSISENRDARTELELVRRLIGSTLLSLASPVDRRWDPYDVKPQVFALDTYIALPVFTSLRYLQLFCRRFNFTVRDPSGVLWAAGANDAAEEDRVAGLLPEGVVQSEWWSQRQAQQARTTEATLEQETSGEAVSSEVASYNDRIDADVEQEAGASSLDQQPTENTEAKPVHFSSTGDNLGATTTAAEAQEDLMDASFLFDAMTMESVAVDAASSAPLKRSKKKQRNHKAKTSRLPRRGHAAPRSRVNKRPSKQPLRKGGRDKNVRSKSAASSAAGEEVKVEAARAAQEEAKATYWQTVAQTAPFELKQATPLPTFGPFLHPFLLGYFADITTLLHNAAIVPEKVDVVVNPGSPIEFVLARAATDRVLHKAQLLHTAYLRVEKELQREFSTFFSLYCPEVLCAFSACVPLPLDTEEKAAVRRASRSTVGGSGASANPLQEYRERTRLLREAEYRNGVAYELTILIRSSSLEETFMKIQQAKRQSMLMGHADLDVLPETAAAPYVRELAHVFYDGASEQEKRFAQESLVAHNEEVSSREREGEEGESRHAVPAAESRMGVFVRRGPHRTINVAQSADSYFHDPTNAYTEAHAIFTEELKVKKRH